MMWMYVYEPRMNRELLIIAHNDEAKVYVKMHPDPLFKRPAYWTLDTTLRRSGRAQMTIGDLSLALGDGGMVQVEGRRARGERYAQLFETVRMGPGWPAWSGLEEASAPSQAAAPEAVSSPGPVDVSQLPTQDAFVPRDWADGVIDALPKVGVHGKNVLRMIAKTGSVTSAEVSSHLCMAAEDVGHLLGALERRNLVQIERTRAGRETVVRVFFHPGLLGEAGMKADHFPGTS